MIFKIVLRTGAPLKYTLNRFVHIAYCIFFYKKKCIINLIGDMPLSPYLCFASKTYTKSDGTNKQPLMFVKGFLDSVQNLKGPSQQNLITRPVLQCVRVV